MYCLGHVITFLTVQIAKQVKIVSFWHKLQCLILSIFFFFFFGFLEHENHLKTLFLSYTFDFKGFGREFPNYEEAQKSHRIHNLLTYLMLRKANNIYFLLWRGVLKKHFYIFTFLVKFQAFNL